MKKLFFYCLVPLLLSACVNSPKIADKPESGGEPDGFYLVSGLEQLERSYVRSAEVFGSYKRIIYAPLSLSDLEIDDSRLDHSESWTLKDGDVENAQLHYSEQLTRVYQQDRNFQLVSDASEGTLLVKMALVKYRPNSPRDSFGDRSSGTQFFSEGAGRLYMKTLISDALSGELLAVMEDDRELGSTWQEDNRVNNVRRFKQGLNTWIVRIDKGLAKLK
ncbi:Protein of unknown function [Alteromonadaceae bacterium Bs31]|nr:Protein of unknown function [Alteromonadaceae bacterium Bs31]